MTFDYLNLHFFPETWPCGRRFRAKRTTSCWDADFLSIRSPMTGCRTVRISISPLRHFFFLKSSSLDVATLRSWRKNLGHLIGNFLTDFFSTSNDIAVKNLDLQENGSSKSALFTVPLMRKTCLEQESHLPSMQLRCSTNPRPHHPATGALTYLRLYANDVLDYSCGSQGRSNGNHGFYVGYVKIKFFDEKTDNFSEMKENTLVCCKMWGWSENPSFWIWLIHGGHTSSLDAQPTVSINVYSNGLLEN